MTHAGLGVLIHQLGGGSKHVVAEYVGAKIKDAHFSADENKFRLRFEDGRDIAISDEGQSCCESRYMVCDDDPQSLIGGTFLGIEIKESETEEEYETHEIAFLEVQTDKGSVTFATHNEHNGYYGGFALNITEETSENA